MGRALQRSPAINQTEQIETAQIPAHTSTHNVEPQTTESVATSIIPSSNTDVPKTAGRESHADTSDAGKSRIASSTREKLSEKPAVPNQSQFTSRDVLDKMKELEKKFLAVKRHHKEPGDTPHSS
jgi:formate dehydrogenase assembly factor FdhD